MSDAIALALIGMFREWGLAIIDKGPSILMAIGSVIVTIGGWWISRKVTAQHKDISNQVCNVREVAVRSKEEADLQAKGAERNAWAEATVKIRAESMPAALRPDFKPESTDVFMGSPDK